MLFSIAENTRFTLDGQIWSVMEYNCVDKMEPMIVARRKGGLVDSFPLGKFSELYRQHKILFIEEEDANRQVQARNQTLNLAIHLSDEQREEIDRRMGYVLAVTQDKKYISNTAERLENIRLQAITNGEKKPSDASVRRWFNMWRAGKCQSIALLPRKGGNKTERLDPAIEKYVEDRISSDYMSLQRITGAELYDRICRGIKADPNLCLLGPPSIKTVYRRIQEIDDYDFVAARFGWDRAQQLFPSGLPVRHPQYAYERFELDHTPIDLIVVDEVTGEPLGQAWATFLIDAYTRMIVGFYIALHAPSRKSVVKAIKHAISPKTYVKELYPNIQNAYPCWGVCSLLAVDNGRDLHAEDARRIMAALNIIVQYCPRKRPNYKGKIERFLKRFNYELVHVIPGTTFANYIKKGDYKEKSRITLPTLVELIHSWVIDDYHTEEQGGIGMAPLQFWNQSQHAFANPVLFDSFERLDQLEWVEFGGTIQTNGISKHNLSWNSQALQNIAKQYGRGTKVDVLLDEDNLGRVRVKVPEQEELIIVSNTNMAYADGLSLARHRSIQAQEKLKKLEFRQLTEPARVAARRRFEEAIAGPKKPLKGKASQSSGAPQSSAEIIQSPKQKSPVSPQAPAEPPSQIATPPVVIDLVPLEYD